MNSRESLPDINRLSIISAVIMLAFALTQIVSFPTQTFSISVFGIILDFSLDIKTIIIILTALLAAAGMDWLILSHPDHKRYQSRWEYVRHWILPVLTTFAIGVTLNTFSGGTPWLVIFGLGSILLMAVLIAEYNIVSAEDVRHPLATIGLTGLSFALYLLLAIAVRSASLRLYAILPILAFGVMMVTSRTLYLRLGEWDTVWALVISLIVSEIAIGFHYLPLSPIQFGVLLMGSTYALTSIYTAIKEKRLGWIFWSEPISMVIVMIVISLVWG